MNDISKPEIPGISEHQISASVAQPQAAPATEPKPRLAQRDMVVDAVLSAGAVFWKDPDGVPYVSIRKEGHTERYKVRSTAFRSVIRAIYADAYPRINDKGESMPGSIADKAMTEALPSLEAMVHRTGTDTKTPTLRSFMDEQDSGTIWVDLGRPDWSVIKVTRAGWQHQANADVALIRADAMRGLPVPCPDAARTALETLRSLLNLSDDQQDEFILVVCWLLGCLWPHGPYPVLAIDGEQGSGKSTLSRLLRSLVDPNKSPLRAPPKTEGDLIVAANAGRVVAIDNVSYIDPDMADVLCRVSTGAGLSKRKLYTDDEEHIVEVCRPILLNGINSALSRGDVADRALVISLRRIEDGKRRLEADIERAFNDAAPGILAALLDGLVAALHYERKPQGDLPRMADFAAMACRAASAFGWTQEDVLGAINRNREAANLAVIESDPMTDILRHVLAEHGSREADGSISWEGSPSTLLERLYAAAPDEVRRDRTWPKDAARLSWRMRRLAPAWRRAGLEVQFPASGGRGGRKITIKQHPEGARPTIRENAATKHEVAQPTTVVTPPRGPAFTASMPERLPDTGFNAANMPPPNIGPEQRNAGNGGNAVLPSPSLASSDLAFDEIEI